MLSLTLAGGSGDRAYARLTFACGRPFGGPERLISYSRCPITWMGRIYPRKRLLKIKVGGPRGLEELAPKRARLTLMRHRCSRERAVANRVVLR